MRGSIPRIATSFCQLYVKLLACEGRFMLQILRNAHAILIFVAYSKAQAFGAISYRGKITNVVHVLQLETCTLRKCGFE